MPYEMVMLQGLCSIECDACRIRYPSCEYASEKPLRKKRYYLVPYRDNRPSHDRIERDMEYSEPVPEHNGKYDAESCSNP